MRRLTRVCVIVAVVAGVAWVLVQFRLLAWLPQGSSSVRNVIEGLSWIWAVLAGLAVLVPVVRWAWGRPEPVSAGDDRSDGHASQSSRSVGDRGVVIEDGVRGFGSATVIGAVTGDGLTVTPASADDAAEPPGPTLPAWE